MSKFWIGLSFWLISGCTSFIVNAQDSWWQPMDNTNEFIKTPQNLSNYRLYQLEEAQLLAVLHRISDNISKYGTIHLPINSSQDNVTSFIIKPSPILERELAGKFPNFQSFTIQAIHNPSLRGRATWTDKGLYVHLVEGDRAIFLEQLILRNQQKAYIFYEGNDHLPSNSISRLCGNHFPQTNHVPKPSGAESRFGGTDLKTFRLAVTATEQFTEVNGGTIESTLSAIMNTTASLNVVFERDLGVRFLLFANNEQLIFSQDNPLDMPDFEGIFDFWENHDSFLDSLIGADSYDIGHVFSVDCGGGIAGVAQLARVCSDEKAQGLSCIIEEDIQEFRRTFYHEIGHQLGANHTWSNCGEGVNNSQRNRATAVEPGSGSTIMSYGGICGPFDIVSSIHDNLHSISILEIQQVLESDSVNCYETIPLDNDEPILNVRESGFSIPILTPFELTATVMDEINGGLTYSWEQLDTGAISEIGFPIGSAPSFRSFAPVREATRTFPRNTDIILNRSTLTEVLPDIDRNLNFGVTVRDNFESGGSTAFAEVAFSASTASGPFLVLSPDTAGIEFFQGDSIEILWDVANTDLPPVNCAEVDISISFNNGQVFTELLAEQIPNNGRAVVQLPDTTTNRARIKIKCANNIFFDISNNRFRIIERTITSTTFLERADIRLYPNPAKQSLRLEFPTDLPKPNNFIIYNALGLQVEYLGENIAPYSFDIDISHLSDGLYFLHGKAGSMPFIQRFMVSR